VFHSLVTLYSTVQDTACTTGWAAATWLTAISAAATNAGRARLDLMDILSWNC
jgi:hypothetical protein